MGVPVEELGLGTRRFWKPPGPKGKPVGIGSSDRGGKAVGKPLGREKWCFSAEMEGVTEGAGVSVGLP